MIGLISLSLTACGGRSDAPIEIGYRPADVPDAAIVAPCDRTERDFATNGAMVDELAVTRKQRNDCASKIDGVRQWRSNAIKRAEALAPKP